MRYFKYKNTNKNVSNALKDQYKTLTSCEKRIFRKEKRWRKFSTIVSHIVFISSAIAGLYLIKSIPQPSGWFLKLLVYIGKAIVGVISLIVAGVFTFGVTMPLWKKVESYHLPTMKKEIFSKACSHLRDYYGLREPYIVTKCFDATDNMFQNHDVCLFVVGDELRITADLMRGFLHAERDLGCYAFRKHEIVLSKQQTGKHLLVELKGDNTIFLLGYRAKAFIEQNLTFKEIE